MTANKKGENQEVGTSPLSENTSNFRFCLPPELFTPGSHALTWLEDYFGISPVSKPIQLQQHQLKRKTAPCAHVRVSGIQLCDLRRATTAAAAGSTRDFLRKCSRRWRAAVCFGRFVIHTQILRPERQLQMTGATAEVGLDSLSK